VSINKCSIPIFRSQKEDADHPRSEKMMHPSSWAFFGIIIIFFFFFILDSQKNILFLQHEVDEIDDFEN